MKFNKVGYNQILSDEYRGMLPSKIIKGDEILFMNKNKIVFIDSINTEIILEFNYYLTNFSFMFSNLTTISYIYIYYMFGKNSNMSYMFYNCSNLSTFSYETFKSDNSIREMKGMFFNCLSLKSFYFHSLNTYYNEYYDINISYMFYNCQNLNSITFDSNYLYYISDMKAMFYNCFSLTYIDLKRIKIRNYIDISYAFYNCKKLTSFGHTEFSAKDIRYMFYNCNSLSSIDLSKFNTSSYYLNMSNLFYNCNKLSKINGNFIKFYISDVREMFYNCTSLEVVDFHVYFMTTNINMSKMFYQCDNIKIISFKNTANYYYPSDLSSIFYNCSSLGSLYFSNFRTNYLLDISYMFYNCKNLSYFYLTGSNFYNSLTTNMRGVFQNCKSLTSLSFYFYTPKAETMWDMFKGCEGLKSLYLGNFDTSKVTDMESMFEGCSNLTSLDLSSFSTGNVRYMNKMFSGCSKLETINFKYISSRSLGTMYRMFYNCNSLKYLNIFYLTEKAQTIEEMFKGVPNDLTYCINDYTQIPNIFSELYQMNNSIMDCSSNCYGYNRFKYPESKVCCVYYEYNGTCYRTCPSKTRIETPDNKCTFFTCPYYYNYQQNDCINSSIVPEGYFVNDTKLKTIDKCDRTCKTCSSKTNCLICDSYYPYYFFGKCLRQCEFGYYTDSDTGVRKCKCIIKECEECTEESIKEGLCKTCALNYYPKSDEYISKPGFKKCYKDPPNYYLNSNSKIYERCFSSCEKCFGSGNTFYHNCKTCAGNYSIAIPKIYNGYETKNCYKNCSYYFYLESQNIICTDDEECPPHYEYLVPDLRQCLKSCSDSDGYFKIFRKNCYKKCPPGESKEKDDNSNVCKVICPYDKPFIMVEKQICVASCTIMERKNKLCVTDYEVNRTVSELQNLVQTNIKEDLIDKFNFSVITNNETVVIEEINSIYEITSTSNKNKNSKTSSIELGQCEYTLKEYYNIPEKEPLIIYKIDTKVEGKTGPSVLYQVFYPLIEPNKLEPLDLTVCEGEIIDISFPIDLENPELYDKESPYYHDICYSNSTKGKVDKIIDDRREEYSTNNKSLCEEGCTYAGYDLINKQVDCSCFVNFEFPLISEIKIDKNKLYKFMDIKKIANFNVLKCYRLVFSKVGLVINIGFYVFTIIAIVYFICIVLFYKRDYIIIKNIIKDLVYAKENLKYLKDKKKKNNKKPIKNKKPKFIEPVLLTIMKAKDIDLQTLRNKGTNKRKNNNIINKNTKQNSQSILIGKKNNTIIEENTEENNKSNDEDTKKEKEDEYNINNEDLKNAPPKKNPLTYNIKTENKKETENNSPKINTFPGNDNLFDLNEDKKVLTQKEEKKIRELIKYTDDELNELDYKEAIKFDKRTYCLYYISLLKFKHLLFKIMNSNDYNSRMIKIYLFFYNFGTCYTVNALFFNDASLHKIYLEDGDFNIIYQLPQILYSTIISVIIDQILRFFALSEKKIISFKQAKISHNIELQAEKLLRILFCKFLNFFVISFLILLVFWYYISCFCAVYKNTQYHLTKDTLISFGTSMITPLGINLIPGIFRIPSIKNKKSYLYKVSKIIQLI